MAIKKISVILPTYNRGWCIERAINSVVNQTYNNWELIIIDDGSIDETKKIVTSFFNDDRIKYFFQENKGVNFARNKGIDLSIGDLIILLDSDDELIDGAFSIINEEFKKKESEKIAILLFNCIDVNGKLIGTSVENGGIINFKDWISQDKFSGEKLVVFSKIIKDEGFRFINSRGAMEGLFWCSIAKKYNTKFIDKALRIYHTEHNDRLTGIGQLVEKAKHQSEIYDIFLQKFEGDIKRIKPKRLSYIYLEKGLNEIINKENKKGRVSVLTVIKYNKRKIFLVGVCYVLSFLPNKIFIKLAKIGHRFKAILK